MKTSISHHSARSSLPQSSLHSNKRNINNPNSIGNSAHSHLTPKDILSFNSMKHINYIDQNQLAPTSMNPVETATEAFISTSVVASLVEELDLKLTFNEFKIYGYVAQFLEGYIEKLNTNTTNTRDNTKHDISLSDIYTNNYSNLEHTSPNTNPFKARAQRVIPKQHTQHK
ncbi:MAG: hypothetical protein ISQ34_03150 [Rickettsiales bacterium]|nr:hypothetical protein [Rickettsiales bacterium]